MWQNLCKISKTTLKSHKNIILNCILISHSECSCCLAPSNNLSHYLSLTCSVGSLQVIFVSTPRAVIKFAEEENRRKCVSNILYLYAHYTDTYIYIYIVYIYIAYLVCRQTITISEAGNGNICNAVIVFLLHSTRCWQTTDNSWPNICSDISGITIDNFDKAIKCC